MQVADLIAAMRFACEQLEGTRLSSMLRELADTVADEGHGAFQRKRQHLLDTHRALAHHAEDGVSGDCRTSTVKA